MGDYIEKGHAEKVPAEEVNPKIDYPGGVSAAPSSGTSFKTRDGKSRVRLCCQVQAGIFKRTLQGPDEANQLVGVLSRFRQEPVGSTKSW